MTRSDLQQLKRPLLRTRYWERMADGYPFFVRGISPFRTRKVYVDDGHRCACTRIANSAVNSWRGRGTGAVILKRRMHGGIGRPRGFVSVTYPRDPFFLILSLRAIPSCVQNKILRICARWGRGARMIPENTQRSRPRVSSSGFCLRAWSRQAKARNRYMRRRGKLAKILEIQRRPCKGPPAVLNRIYLRDEF